MPERVRADPETRAACGDVAADQPIDAPRRQPSTLVVQKQRLTRPAALRPSRLGLTQRLEILQPHAERGLSALVERNDALFPALAQHANHPSRKIDVLQIKADELAQAKA